MTLRGELRGYHVSVATRVEDLSFLFFFFFAGSLFYEVTRVRDSVNWKIFSFCHIHITKNTEKLKEAQLAAQRRGTSSHAQKTRRQRSRRRFTVT